MRFLPSSEPLPSRTHPRNCSREISLPRNSRDDLWTQSWGKGNRQRGFVICFLFLHALNNCSTYIIHAINIHTTICNRIYSKINNKCILHFSSLRRWLFNPTVPAFLPLSLLFTPFYCPFWLYTPFYCSFKNTHLSFVLLYNTHLSIVLLYNTHLSIVLFILHAFLLFSLIDCLYLLFFFHIQSLFFSTVCI